MRLGELAEALGIPLTGDSSVRIRAVASLEAALGDELAFVQSEAEAGRLASCRAGAVVAPPELDVAGRPALRSSDPRAALSRAARLLHPEPRPAAGVHPSAHVADTAKVDPGARVDAQCSVGAGATVGVGCVLHAGVVLGPGVELGRDCVLHARCVVTAGARLGDRVVLQPGVVIGGAGFGYTGGTDGLEKVHDVGSVVIGDDVEIGANSCVDRGALGDTSIGRGTKIDDLVMIGHNCRIGEGVVIVAQAGLAGSCVVEDGAVILAQAGIAGHLRVGKGAVVGPQSGVHRDVEAGASVLGTPARPGRRFHTESAALSRLPDVLRRVRDLERERGDDD